LGRLTVILRRSFAAAVAALFVANCGFAADTAPVNSFGTLRNVAPEAAKAKAKAWLESVNQYNAAAFDKIWADAERSVFDRTVDSLLAGSSEAKAALETARDANAPAPITIPAIFKDSIENTFARANLATAYAKALGAKRIYEESLEALKAVAPEQVVEPAQYFFYRAVAEHALLKKEEAITTVIRLVEEVTDVPDRYKAVSAMIYGDAMTWSPDRKDLANIGRLMDNSGRRLDLARGGKTTQDIQKKIIFSLDEKIKEVENQCKGNCNGGSCPNGGPGKPGSTNTPSGPQADSFGGGSSGEGKIDEVKLEKFGEEWGKMQPEERAKAIQETYKNTPAKFRPQIEAYFNRLNELNNVKP